MYREQHFLSSLDALRSASRQAHEALETMGGVETSRVVDLNGRRHAIHAFRMRLAEMKWMCLQMEIVLAEAPFTRNACNDGRA
ncbi:hypothetical protein [Herbaspirillum seropedicae]|uniref:hypothetical protein n=1 Tax=Herbaspirillum seropedicae TaxID=964 RepID=UPI003D96873C